MITETPIPFAHALAAAESIVKHKGLIVYWAKRFNRCLPHAFEDVMQEATIAWARAWEKSIPESPEARRVAYASRAMQNHLISMVAAHRAKMRSAVCVSLDAPSRLGVSLHDVVPTVAPSYSEDVGPIVEYAVASLSTQDRDLLYAVYVDQEPVTTIAARLDLTRQAVYLRLRQAAARFRRALPATALRDFRDTFSTVN